MDAYATVDDLEAGWRTLTDTETERAEVLLLRASGYILARLNAAGVEVDGDDELQVLNLCTVCCNLVQRAMGGGVEGVSQMSQTIGSTSASVTWSNPDARFFLTQADLDLLGIGSGGRFAWLPLVQEDDDV